AGIYSNIIISVSDGSTSARLSSFTITVNNLNRAPTISGSPVTSMTAGETYQFAPTSNDPDGNTLHFYIRNKPQWANFDQTTGALTGITTAADAGVYSDILIMVGDGLTFASLPAFNITVITINNPPVISGTPATRITANSAYSFIPAASDADHDNLTFSIQNKPVWASFNTSTGALTGTPSNAYSGTIARNITISVSDGQSTVALTPFDIDVVAAVITTGSITLSWSAPLENTDNSTLTDLSGFKIYYGTSSGNYTNIIDLSNPSLSSYIIDTLPSATYYIVISAYNSSGVQSSYSNEAIKVIP
ncbi:MAG: putative Ig domain-containing protein, partial [Gammaproteobacteria bacterium]|nr:putative Ig domain-containing protein [Gammaproteobacteria bacterium]